MHALYFMLNYVRARVDTRTYLLYNVSIKAKIGYYVHF